MKPIIRRYPVEHALLRNFIKFFWEIRIEEAELSHRIIPQRNITMRFNLSDTPQFAISGQEVRKLEPVNFAGLQDKPLNTRLTMHGKAHIMGICFYPDGFYPFVKIPANTFIKLNRFHLSLNQLLKSDYEKYSDLAFDNGYFDQMHFIHDFKRFTGDTPGRFENQNDSLLQVGKLS